MFVLQESSGRVVGQLAVWHFAFQCMDSFVYALRFKLHEITNIVTVPGISRWDLSDKKITWTYAQRSGFCETCPLLADGFALTTFRNYFGPCWMTITGKATSHKIAKRHKHKHAKFERAYVCVNNGVLFLQTTPTIKPRLLRYAADPSICVFIENKIQI